MAETPQHKTMIRASNDLFQSKGYVVFTTERFEKYIPDVLAIKDDEKIGIECETHLSRKKIWSCLKYGLNVVDRIIFVVPKDKKIDELKKEIIMSEDKLSLMYFPFDKHLEEQCYKLKGKIGVEKKFSDLELLFNVYIVQDKTKSIYRLSKDLKIPVATLYGKLKQLVRGGIMIEKRVGRKNVILLNPVFTDKKKMDMFIKKLSPIITILKDNGVSIVPPTIDFLIKIAQRSEEIKCE